MRPFARLLWTLVIIRLHSDAGYCCYRRSSVVCVLVMSVSSAKTPRGAEVPPFRLCSSFVHSLPHLLLFITFPLFLFSFT